MLTSMHIKWQYMHIYIYMWLYHLVRIQRIIWTLVQGFLLKSTFLHKQTGCDFAVWMSFIRWGYFSWIMKWHRTWKFGMQLSAAVLIAARGSMHSISLKKFLVLSYDLFSKKTPKINWIPINMTSVYWTVWVLFFGPAFLSAWKYPLFGDHLKTCIYIDDDDDDEWMNGWLDEGMIECMQHAWMNERTNELTNERMNEMNEVCDIHIPLNQQFPKRFPPPTEKKNTSRSKQQIRQNIGPPNVVTYGAVLAACDWGRQGWVRGPVPSQDGPLLVIHAVISLINDLING